MNRFVIIGIVVIFLFFLSCLFPQRTFANLLLNSSFEVTSSGTLSNWTKNVSTVTLSSSTTVKSGTMSASINKANSSTGTIYAYQDVDVESNSYYSLSGYAVKNSSNFSWVVLRVSWRDSSSAEISKTDSSQLTTDSSDFQLLKIDSVQAPSSSIKGRVELVGNITTINPSSPILFDDIDFSQVSAPEQPTSSPPTSIPIPTNVPTSTTSPTKSPTSTPIPSKVITPSITIEPTALEMEDENTLDTLGEATISGEIASSPEKTKVSDIKNSKWPQIFMIAGGLILIACGILFYWIFYKKKDLLWFKQQ